MTPELPHWHPYDPGESPPDIDFGEDSSLVVLLATPGASANGWAERAAVALARSWAKKGERVFLADLGLTNPRLHEAVGEPNGEGMSDAFLYGASLRRIARPHAGGFFFAPAGTPVADGAKVLGSSRWGVLAHGFARAGAHLVVFLPSDETGREAVLARAERVLVLASPGESGVLSHVGEAAGRVAAVLWPSGSPPPGRAPGGQVSTPAGARAEAPLAPASAARTLEAKASAEGPRADEKAAASPAPRSSRRLVLLLALLLVMVLVLVGLASLGVVRLPGLGGAPASPAPSAAAPGGFPPPAGPAGEEPEQGGAYSLTLGSYTQAAVAELQAESLGARRGDILFVVAPVEVEGEVYHRLLAGVAVDSGAVELRESLGRTLTEEDPTSWVVRSTPLAFHLGSFATLAEARTRAQGLQAVDIPAYVLSRTDLGRARYDVWAGAYADEGEAGYLRRVLGVDAVDALLRRREGELPR